VFSFAPPVVDALTVRDFNNYVRYLKQRRDQGGR